MEHTALVHGAVMLVVRDLDRSITFYGERLGLRLREQQPGIALLEMGNLLLYLIPESPPTPDKPGLTLGPLNTSDRTSVNLVFRVIDCRAVVQSLRERGLTFLTPPQQPPWGGWRCFTRDPDGYLIEIEQP